jgi:hypothetical protein
LEPCKEVPKYLSFLESFVDERDNDIPGPGAHNAQRIDKFTVTQCKFGKDT